MKSKMALFLVAGFLIAPSAFSAPIPAAVPGDPVSRYGFVYPTSTYYGWQFAPLTDIYVTALGFNEFRWSVPDAVYPVEIWRVDDSSLVTRAMINANPAASDDLLLGYYRYVDVDPALLRAGTSYQIIGQFPDILPSPWLDDGEMIVGTRSTTTFNGVTYEGFGRALPVEWSIYWPLLEADELRDSRDGKVRLAANFLFETVPEPGTLALLGLGLIGLGLSRRRRAN